MLHKRPREIWEAERNSEEAPSEPSSLLHGPSAPPFPPFPEALSVCPKRRLRLPCILWAVGVLYQVIGSLVCTLWLASALTRTKQPAAGPGPAIRQDISQGRLPGHMVQQLPGHKVQQWRARRRSNVSTRLKALINRTDAWEDEQQALRAAIAEVWRNASAAKPPPLMRPWEPPPSESTVALAGEGWGERRIRLGLPLRVACAGLSRSGSTWQASAHAHARAHVCMHPYMHM